MNSPALFLSAAFLLLAASCGSARKAPAPKEGGQAKARTAKPVRSKTMDSDSNNALGLQSIHFPAVSLVVEDSERAKLVRNAEILKANPKVMVEIEGHTDGRGKMDQSLELGEARAQVVKAVMEGLGIAPSRMSTISYGRDRVLDRSGTEQGYAKNRRVNFLILRY